VAGRGTFLVRGRPAQVGRGFVESYGRLATFTTLSFAELRKKPVIKFGKGLQYTLEREKQIVGRTAL